MHPFRLLASAVTLIGICLLVLALADWQTGLLAEKFFPEATHAREHHLYGLLLALPVPLHIIFIGLIVQKRWLSPTMARFALVGIITSGLWLGAALIIKIVT